MVTSRGYLWCCLVLQYRALQCSGVSDSILAVKLSAIRALRARGVLPVDVFGVQEELQVPKQAQ